MQVIVRLVCQEVAGARDPKRYSTEDSAKISGELTLTWGKGDCAGLGLGDTARGLSDAGIGLCFSSDTGASSGAGGSDGSFFGFAGEAIASTGEGNDAGTVGAGAGMGTVGTVAVLWLPATAAAAAAAYLIGGRAAGFGGGATAIGVGSTGFGGSFDGATGGAGAAADTGSGLPSIVGFLNGCFFATGLGGCSSRGVTTVLLVGVNFFSRSSFAGVFGASDGSVTDSESRLETSSLCKNS